MSIAAWPTPPFATSARHLARLADGGRLVAITGASFAPDNPAWTDAFVRLQERGRVVFSAAIDGSVYAKHGTTIDTRLTVIDKRPAEDPGRLPGFAGHRARRRHAARLGDGSTFRRGCRSLPPSAFADSRASGRSSRTRPRLPPHARPPSRPARPSPRRSNSPMRRSIGSRPKAAASPMRFMKNTDCSRSVFPALRPIRPAWCNRPRWRRSRRRSPPIDRISGQRRLRRPAVRRPARERHLCRRGPFRPPRRIVDGGRDLRHRLGRARRR